VKFVGVDLAWSERNPSGVAVIEADGTLGRAASHLRSNQEICQYTGLSEEDDAVVAIDAPLIVSNAEGQRPVERELTKMFGPFDAGPHSASLKNQVFRKTGRIQQFIQMLEPLGFKHWPRIRKQRSQRVFLEVFPSPAQVILFPGITHADHCHYRPPRYKFKRGRSWAETQCEWEIYRARLLSLRAKKPPITFSADVKKSLHVDIEDYRGSRYKALDDLLDGIFCAYLAYYFWHWGDEGCCVVGNTESGYVALPHCQLPNCQLPDMRNAPALIAS
jgi:predicted RNase H-like nuclease